MNFVRTVRQLSGLRRALTLLQKPLAPAGSEGHGLIPAAPAGEGHCRGYQSLQGVYGHKHQEPKEFSCE